MKIFYHASVYTGTGFTDAFAVEDGRFAAIGAEALALQGERIDLNGAFVCAGFNDSHMHLLNYGTLQIDALALKSQGIGSDGGKTAILHGEGIGKIVARIDNGVVKNLHGHGRFLPGRWM